MESGFVDVAQRSVLQQAIHHLRQRGVAVGFGNVGVAVVVARRIEQAQTREVTTAAQLFRRRGQKDQTGAAFAQRFYQRVRGACRFGRPREVVRLVDDHQIPTGGNRLVGAFRIVGKEVGAGDHQLFVFKRIAAIAADLDRFAAFFIKQGKGEVEATQQFNKPLVDQAFRNQHQYPRDATDGK